MYVYVHTNTFAYKYIKCSKYLKMANISDYGSPKGVSSNCFPNSAHKFPFSFPSSGAINRSRNSPGRRRRAVCRIPQGLR